MGKCIVCNKSAGPFYSLHKVCLPVYRDAQQCLKAKLSSYLDSEEEESIADIKACRPSEGFSEYHFKQICIKAWQEHARNVVSQKSLNVPVTKKLLNFANEFDIYKNETEPYLISRLMNIEYLQALQNNQSIEFHSSFDMTEIELNQGEHAIWQFDEIDKSEQHQYSQQKSSTIFNTLLDNLFMKSRYKPLDVKLEKSGKLLITNQALHYLLDNSVKETKFSDIHSVTPMKNGIRVQAATRNASPDTYITGDGRFTYALLQYAQGKEV